MMPAAKTLDDILEEFGFEDGDECSASPHGNHEWEEDRLFTGRARCFWCNCGKGSAD